MGGMYKRLSSNGTRMHNEITSLRGKPQIANNFENEYAAFIAEQKKLLAEKEEKETAERIAEETSTVEEPILPPEQSFVQTEVTEPVEPIKVEVVEEPVVAPVKTAKKKKTSVTEEA